MVLVLGTFYYVSTKLSSEDVRLFLVSSIQKAMPGTQVSIEQIDYNWGPSVTFEVQGLDVKLKKDRPGSELFFVRRAFIRIPVWAILFKGDEINIIVSSPQVNYYEYRNGLNNWNLAKGEQGKKAARPDKKRPWPSKVLHR